MGRKKQPLSQSAYARQRGCSVEAVSKAIAEGRLTSAVILVDGVPKIADSEVADREWDANTRPRADRPRQPRRSREATIEDDEDGDLPADVPPYKVSRARRESEAARREAALADLAEIEVAEKNEDLVPFDEARAYMIDKFTIIKTKLLGVPSRVAQQLPHIAAEVEPVIDGLIREVLEELATEDDDGGEEDESE